MAGLPTAMFWRRLDTAGSEQVLYSDRAGLRARGTMLATTPVPFACRYELYTDDTWATARFEVTVEGAGFLRSARLERAAGRWRVTATEQGNLDAALIAAGHPRAALPGSEEPAKLAKALDVDLGYSPLTNTLPFAGSVCSTPRRAPAGTSTWPGCWYRASKWSTPCSHTRCSKAFGSASRVATSSPISTWTSRGTSATTRDLPSAFSLLWTVGRPGLIAAAWVQRGGSGCGRPSHLVESAIVVRVEATPAIRLSLTIRCSSSAIVGTRTWIRKDSAPARK